MKQYGHIILSVLPFLPTLLVMMCIGPADVTEMGETSEPTSATISENLWTDDGVRARDATVRLIPADFNPFSSTDPAGIDSVITNSEGHYIFSIKTSGIFNMSAEREGKYCFEDSIFGSTKHATIVHDDTLKPPGSISGIARLKKDDDNREIIILVLGCTVYTMPSDTSGAFSIPALAEGECVLRILTTDNDYRYLDTVVTVRSGENTVIGSPLQPLFDGVTAVESIDVVLDTQLMMVTLAWPPCDTTKISGYYIFRNNINENEPSAILPKAATTFEDTILLLDPDTLPFHDTLRYSIAAVGNNQNISKITAADDVLIRSMLTLVDTIPLSAQESIPQNQARYLHIDDAYNFYVYGWEWIMKFDSTGRFVSQYFDENFQDTVSAGGGVYFNCLTCDSRNNIYALQPGGLIKFSPELQPVTLKTIENATPHGCNMLLTDMNDLIHLFLVGDLGTTVHTSFDTTLSEIDQDTIPENICLGRQYDDTIYFITPNDADRLYSYDIQSGTLGSRGFDILFDDYPADATNLAYGVRATFHASNGSVVYLSGNKLLVFDRNGRFIWRCRFPDNGAVAFGGDDRLYLLDGTGTMVLVYGLQ